MFKKFRRNFRKKMAERREFNNAEVCLVSFPKSGRTWLRVLIGKALCDKFELDEKMMLETTALTEAAGLPSAIWTHDGTGNTEGNHYKKLNPSKKAYAKKKVILLVRDPRDVVVSCFFEATKRKGVYQGEISDFIRSDIYGIRKILTFYNQWSKQASVPRDFLLLRYERMHADPNGALRLALTAMGVEEIEEDIIEKAVQFSRYENMKKMERDGAFNSKKMRPGDPQDAESFKVRKGKVAGYRQYFSAEDCDYAANLIEEMASPFYPKP